MTGELRDHPNNGRQRECAEVSATRVAQCRVIGMLSTVIMKYNPEEGTSAKPVGFVGSSMPRDSHETKGAYGFGRPDVKRAPGASSTWHAVQHRTSRVNCRATAFSTA